MQLPACEPPKIPRFPQRTDIQLDGGLKRK